MYIPGFDATEQGSRTIWQKLVPEKVSQKITGANLIGLVGAFLALACLLGLPADQYWNIRVPLYLLISIWVCVRPRIALYLLPLAIPWGSLDPLGGLSSADVLIALLAASWLLSHIVRPYLPRYRIEQAGGVLDYEPVAAPRALIMAMTILLLTMVLSMTVAADYVSSLKELIKWVEVLIVLALSSQYLRTRRQIWTIVVIIGIAGISQALLGYAQLLFNLGPSSFVRDASLRVYGTFDQPNPYAGYINMILAPSLALVLLGRGRTLRILAGGMALVLAGVEIFSQSKGGWMAIVVAGIAILLIGFPRLRPFALAVCILFLLFLIAYVIGIIPASLVEPVLIKVGVIGISFTNPTPDNFANSERVAHWLVGILIFQDHPLIGVGIGNYASAYASYAPGIFTNPLGHAHNYYINIAAETGTIGLVAFLLFLSFFFAAGIRAYRGISARYQQARCALFSLRRRIPLTEKQNSLRQSGILVNDRALAIGLLAALLSTCVHNLVDNLYVHSMTSMFALLLVLLIRLEGTMASRTVDT